MPRKRMVTRTVKVVRVSANVANIKEQTFGTMEVIVPRMYKDVAKLEKKTQEIVGNDVKILTIYAVTPEEIRYGMTEEDFVRNEKTVVLPPKKDNEKEDEESEEE